jgi:WD40 repeat protein
MKPGLPQLWKRPAFVSQRDKEPDMLRRLLCAFVFLILPGTAVFPAQTAAPPYVYYYSDTLNAFVIERADGTDSRAIAQDLMPADHTIISGPGWSPSGQWFAWTSTYPGEYLDGPRSAWIIRSDGQERLDILDDVMHAAYMSWSPTGDYLFVIDAQMDVSVIGEGSPPEKPGFDVYLIDVAEKRLAAFFNDIDVESIRGMGYQAWSEDGDNVYFMYRSVHVQDDGQLEYGDLIERMVYVDGSVVDTPDIILPRYAALQSDVEVNDGTADDSTSPDGRYSASFYGRILLDTDMGTRFEMRPFSGQLGDVCAYLWHLDSQWLIREDNMVYAGGGCQGGAMLVSVDGRVQRELGLCRSLDAGCAGWLPERVLPFLVPGKAVSVVPGPIVILEHRGYVLGVEWSPADNRLATYEEDWTVGEPIYRLHLWRITDTTADLERTFEIASCSAQMFWPCTILWSSAGTLIGLTGADGTHISDAGTGSTVLTSDDALAGWVDDNPVLLDTSAAYDPQHDRVAQISASENGTRIEITDQAGGETFAMLPLDPDVRYWKMSFDFLPDGDGLVYALTAGETDLGIWDFSTDRLVAVSTAGQQILGVLAAPDNSIIAGYGQLTRLRLWQQDGTLMTQLNRYAAAVDISHDSRFLTTESGYVAEVWDLRNDLQRTRQHGVTAPRPIDVLAHRHLLKVK